MCPAKALFEVRIWRGRPLQAWAQKHSVARTSNELAKNRMEKESSYFLEILTKSH